MKPLPESACVLQLILIYLGINMVLSQQSSHYEDPQVHASNQQNVELDYSMYDDKKDDFFCYSCVYHVRQGNAAGHQNCRDPFIKTDIPKVPCSGACAKMYHKISDTEYTITRTCLPNCKDMKDHEGYTQCCTGSLCNGGAASKGVSCLVITSSVAASTWYIFR